MNLSRLPNFLLFLGLAFSAIASTPLAAQSSPASYLAGEREIRVHDQLLSQLADSLESWLAGRQKHSEIAAEIAKVSQKLTPYRTLPNQSGKEVLQREMEMVGRIRAFSGLKEPDGEGQRTLFLALSQDTESRTLRLLRWRRDSLHHLLSLDLTPPQHAYFRWEAAWIPIWTEEAELTRKLQSSFLEPKTELQQKKQVLQSLLRLRLRAENTACPEAYRDLDAKLKQRLTLLARTAEQLLRLEQQQSSGAVTRVRRLSRQLSELTERFQSGRLDSLRALTSQG